jgi:hypothetical protein
MQAIFNLNISKYVSTLITLKIELETNA